MRLNVASSGMIWFHTVAVPVVGRRSPKRILIVVVFPHMQQMADYFDYWLRVPQTLACYYHLFPT